MYLYLSTSIFFNSYGPTTKVEETDEIRILHILVTLWSSNLTDLFFFNANDNIADKTIEANRYQ